MTQEVSPHHIIPTSDSDQYPNDTIQLLSERSSCRNFTGETIDPAILDLILEAASHAPSGGNLQPFSIIKIEKPERRRRLADFCQQEFIAVAPTLLIFCIDQHRQERWARLEYAPFTANDSFPNFWIAFQDTIIAAQNICIAAEALGLGSVYIGTVVDYLLELHEMLALPQGVLPVTMVCLGYSKSPSCRRRKLPVRALVHNETYQEMDDETLLNIYNEKYTGQRLDISEERLATLSEICQKIHGKDYAEKCLQRIEENGYIRPAQRLYGLHYRADEMIKYNKQYIRSLKKIGFNIFDDRGNA